MFCKSGILNFEKHVIWIIPSKFVFLSTFILSCLTYLNLNSFLSLFSSEGLNDSRNSLNLGSSISYLSPNKAYINLSL